MFRTGLAAAAAMALLAGCQGMNGDVSRSGIEAIEESELNAIMMQLGDPRVSVNHFRRAAAAQPERSDLKRALAQSLARAGDHEAAAAVWRDVGAAGALTSADGVAMAEALIRSGDMGGARSALAAVPPTYETYDRYRLEAIVADQAREWSRADAFYENAVALTSQPGGVYNNWGFSKLTRGDHRGAEKMFQRAIQEDPSLFTAKNNLVLALGAQRRYDLPLVPMTQVERAQLLHTMGLTAVKQGDISTGRTLLSDAVNTHPQHFDAAARALATLDGVRN